MITKLIKKTLKLFIPPIIIPINFRTFIIEFFLKKNLYEYQNTPQNRLSIITKILSKYSLKNTAYLEIGVSDGFVFNSIPLILNKIGVDPVRGGTHRMPSDKFFSINKKKFDVIFIDGLHEHEQCSKDFYNSLMCLKENGFIVLHDLLPRNFFEEHYPQIDYKSWTGNVWKTAVEITLSKNIKFCIANFDMGVGICYPTKGYNFLRRPELLKKNFDDYKNKYRKILPIVTLNEAFNFIDKNKKNFK